jgi:hypothetical protein
MKKDENELEVAHGVAMLGKWSPDKERLGRRENNTQSVDVARI